MTHENEKVARERLRSVLSMLSIYVEMLKLEEPGAELELAIVATRADGSGRVGPKLEYGPFLDDIARCLGFEDVRALIEGSSRSDAVRRPEER